MLKYSKEYVNKYQPGIAADFSVIQIFKTLGLGHLYEITCNGFSFSAIANIEQVCKVRFEIVGTSNTQWIPFELIDENYHERFNKGAEIINLLYEDERIPQEFTLQFKAFVGISIETWTKRATVIDDKNYHLHILVCDEYRLYQEACNKTWILQRIANQI
jgi:hypothetical protein